MRHLSGGVCFSLAQSRLKNIEKAGGRHLGVRATVSSPHYRAPESGQARFLASDCQQNALGRLGFEYRQQGTRSFR